MPKVIHLLPYDGIGGAEMAANSMSRVAFDNLDFHVRFLFPHVRSRRQRIGTFNPLVFLSTVRQIIREQPDILIVSLWRACLAGMLVKALKPQTRLVVMIHNSVDAHLADWICTRLSMVMCDAVWSDSAMSMALRFRKQSPRPVTVIPFIIEHVPPARPLDDPAPPDPAFIFWGRLAAQKNLPMALEIFRNVRRVYPSATYTVIGPDSGELEGLQAWCVREGLGSAVSFAGPLPFEAIQRLAREHSFYLQTSAYEGMAIAVVEAMQLGLVPVVTPVGEIARYCHDGENALFVVDAGDAVARVLRILDTPAEWQALRRRAIESWQGQQLYRDAVAAACLTLMAQGET